MIVELFLLFIGSFMWFGIIGALSGNSLPPPFQIKAKWAGQVPEILFALSIAGAWTYIRNIDGGLTAWVNIHDFIRDAVLVYFGKQAATWAMLSSVMIFGYQRDDNGDGVVNYSDGRKSKIKNIADDLAEAVNVPITDPRYGAVWAFLKGVLMTFPIGFGIIGGVFHALGHWGVIKTLYNKDGTGKVKYPNAYKEWVGTGLCGAGTMTIAYGLVLIF